MANNRMYLRCKGCGEEFFIGKRFADGYHIGQYDQYKGVPLIDRLNKFYADHIWCGNAGLDCFELIYEDSPEPHTAADVWPNKTYGDMLRRMDNNNLAEWIADRFCPPGQKKQLFRQAWLDWLNKEVGK